MSKGKDEAFEKAYASVVENGWTNVKHMARQVWDMANATPPAAQVQEYFPSDLLVSSVMNADEIEGLIQARLTARAEKNWAESDRILDQITAMGVVLEDGKCGITWRHDPGPPVAVDIQNCVFIGKNADGSSPFELKLEQQGVSSIKAVKMHGWHCVGPLLSEEDRDRISSAPPAAGVPEDCVEPYGWVAAGRFFLDRDQAIEAAEKTPCVEVYSRPQMLATSPTPPASEQPDAVSDTVRLDFMLQQDRKVIVERVPGNKLEIYVEEGVMGDEQYPAIKHKGSWDGSSAEAAALKRKAIDMALLSTRQAEEDEPCDK